MSFVKVVPPATLFATAVTLHFSLPPLTSPIILTAPFLVLTLILRVRVSGLAASAICTCTLSAASAATTASESTSGSGGGGGGGGAGGLSPAGRGGSSGRDGSLKTKTRNNIAATAVPNHASGCANFVYLGSTPFGINRL